MVKKKRLILSSVLIEKDDDNMMRSNSIISLKRSFSQGLSFLTSSSFRDHHGIKYLPMPRLSPSMEKGKILKWLIKPKDFIGSYQLVLEISTGSLRQLGQTKDFTMEIELLEDMFVADLLVPEGTECTVGTPIASFAENEDEIEIVKANPLPQGTDLYSYQNGTKMTLWQGYSKKP